MILKPARLSLAISFAVTAMIAAPAFAQNAATVNGVSQYLSDLTVRHGVVTCSTGEPQPF